MDYSLYSAYMRLVKVILQFWATLSVNLDQMYITLTLA